MQYACILILILFPCVFCTNELDNIQIFQSKLKELSARNPNIPAYAYLLGALNFIILNNDGSNLQQGSIFDQIENNNVSIDLDSMLFLATQQFYIYLMEKGYDLDDYKELTDDWSQNILEKLKVNGSQAVMLEDMKPFINLLRPGNLWNFYKKNELPSTINRLNGYIYYQFLGGVKNKDCRNYVAKWFQDIQKGESWALSMFDSIGKPPTGLFGANINWVGSYKQCKKIKFVKKPEEIPLFQGKYCTTTLGVPDELLPPGLPLPDSIGLSIGVCIPNQCENEDLESITKKSLELMGLWKFLTIKKVQCQVEEPHSNAFWAYSIIFLTIICLILAATIFDVMKRLIDDLSAKLITEQGSVELKESITGSGVVNSKLSNSKKTNPFVQFILNCSMYLNSERIFRTDNPGRYECLNGIRVLSMVWIVMSHTYNYLGDFTYYFLLENIRDLQDIEKEPVAQLIINGMYGVDTFFLMSAFLLTISFMKKLQKHNGLSAYEWAYYYIHRYWRLVPPYAIIIAIYIYIMPWIGDGPLWNTKDFPIKYSDCKNYWWAYLLLINNFVPNGKGTKCMGYLWYVSNDYQLYAITPIFLIILFKFPMAGIFLLILTLISSTSILGMLTANVYASKNKDMIQVLSAIWEDVYIKPYCRAGPWIIGIFLGYLFFKHQKIRLHKLWVCLGWLLSTGFALSAVFGAFTNHGDGMRRMAFEEYGAYFSMTRITWSLSMGWIIFACCNGYGGIFNRILSSRVFVPLTRISYCAYLIHPVIMVSYMFSQQGLFYGTPLTLIYLFIGHLVLTFIFAYLFTLFFELPFVAIEKLLTGFKKSNNAESE